MQASQLPFEVKDRQKLRFIGLLVPAMLIICDGKIGHPNHKELIKGYKLLDEIPKGNLRAGYLYLIEDDVHLLNSVDFPKLLPTEQEMNIMISGSIERA